MSGGNQQKVIIARWLATEPRVLLLNDPTRGVDHATKQDIYARLHEIAARGIAIVMLSTEVDELLTYMDRVMVFREGTLFTEFGRDDIDRQRLIASFFGREQTVMRWATALSRPWALAAGLTILLIVVNTLVQPQFAAPQYIGGNLDLFAPLALAAVASTPSILAGGIDVSIGPLLGL